MTTKTLRGVMPAESRVIFKLAREGAETCVPAPLFYLSRCGWLRTLQIPLLGSQARLVSVESAQISMWYSFTQFSKTIFRVTSSGTPSKSRAITSRECGQVESACGKSDAHM